MSEIGNENEGWDVKTGVLEIRNGVSELRNEVCEMKIEVLSFHFDHEWDLRCTKRGENRNEVCEMNNKLCEMDMGCRKWKMEYGVCETRNLMCEIGNEMCEMRLGVCEMGNRVFPQSDIEIFGI